MRAGDSNESQTRQLSQKISNLIRHNDKLQHLDLSNTGLNEQVMIDLVPSLKRAKGLVSIHLNFNPGSTA